MNIVYTFIMHTFIMNTFKLCLYGGNYVINLRCSVIVIQEQLIYYQYKFFNNFQVRIQRISVLPVQIFNTLPKISQDFKEGCQIIFLMPIVANQIIMCLLEINQAPPNRVINIINKTLL